MKEKVKLTVGDIIITWCLKLFYDAVFFRFLLFYFFPKNAQITTYSKTCAAKSLGPTFKHF